MRSVSVFCSVYFSVSRCIFFNVCFLCFPDELKATWKVPLSGTPVFKDLPRLAQRIVVLGEMSSACSAISSESRAIIVIIVPREVGKGGLLPFSFFWIVSF